jgi:hypothetical protein
MATPHVTGAAALVWARNPEATPAAVRAALLTTVDPIPALRGKLATGGRLNAGRAVQAAFAPPPPPPPPPAPPKPVKKPVKKVTICFRKRTIKIPKTQLAKYRKKGAKLGACPKPRKHRR